MTSNLGWEYYRTFLAVLTEGSLSGAARALGITQPTAGRHIAALEAAFAQPLFTRTQNGLRPTATALAIAGHAQGMQHLAHALERTASGDAGAVIGSVRIGASEVISVEVLPPLLARLRGSYPSLVLELAASNHVQDLLHREADIAVRMTAPSQGQLIARAVGQTTLGLYAHTDYLEAHGLPADPADLASHSLIGFDRDSPFLRSARRTLPIPLEREHFALRSDSDLVQLALVRAGAGIGFCQVAIAARSPTLVRVLPEQIQFRLGCWITMHEDLRHNLCCRVVFDALVAGMLAHNDAAA